MEQQWQTISEGAGFPHLSPGEPKDQLLNKGELVTGKILGVTHDDDFWKDAKTGRKTMILFKVETAQLRKELEGKIYKHYLRRSRRDAFLASQWGIGDKLSIQYDGVGEYTGKGIPPHLLTYKGLKSENSQFVPDNGESGNTQEQGDPSTPPVEQKRWENKQPPAFNAPQFGKGGS